MRTFKGRFRKPKEEDIKFLVEHMREEDRRELKRWTGVDVDWCVRNSVKQSQVCYAADFEDGSLACIFGATQKNIMSSDAVLWMLSTTNVDTHKVEFAVGSKAGLDLICKDMDYVNEFGNWVDRDYTSACRWIEWFGGTFSIGKNRAGRGGGVFSEFYFVNPYFKED